MSDEALNAHLDWLDECAEEQMTEHVHEWEWDEKIEFYCCTKCFKDLDPADPKTVRRINATERLSPKRARHIANGYALRQDDFNSMKAYADIREGK